MVSGAAMKPGQLLFLAGEAPLAAATSLYLLYKYCGRHGAVPVVVALLVGLVWFMSMLVAVMLPLDLGEAIIARCNALQKTGCDVPKASPEFIAMAWHVSYWVCFSMSWLFLPLVSSYLLAGAFSVRKRILFALRDRLIFFLIIGALIGGALVLLILRFKLSLLGLSGVLVSLANVFGVFVAILMLSYGLIEVPKWLWKFGDYENKLRSCEYRATHTMERVEEAKTSIAKVMGKINHVMMLYENSKKEMPISRRQTIKKYIRLIQAEIPTRDANLTLPKAIQDDDSHCSLTEEFLAALRYKAKKRVIEFRKVNYLWKKRCVEAFELQDLLQWRRGELRSEDLSAKLYFNIRVYILPILSRAAALGSVVLTVAFIWSEATLWTIMLEQKLDLSPFSRLLHYSYPPYILVQVVSFLCVSYLFFCLFFGIFRFRLFMLYELVPKHTDPFTLVINSMLCSRLLIPLAYNFITVMHETVFSLGVLYGGSEKRQIPSTQLAHLHRGMAEVPLLGVGFNLYFPAVIVLFVILTLLRVWDKIMKMADLTTYSFEGIGDERLENFGRNLLAQERTKWVNARRREGTTRPASYMDPNAEETDDRTASAAELGESNGRNKGNGSRAFVADGDANDEIYQNYGEDDRDEDSERIRTELEAFGEDGDIHSSADITDHDRKSSKRGRKKDKTKGSKAAKDDEDSVEF